jgi:hypothetical protein
MNLDEREKANAELFKDCRDILADYARNQHAMQSGVAFQIGRAENEGRLEESVTPKHLRVGLNTAMCDQAALTRLLIRKGIITPEEYAGAIAEEMETEKLRQEARIQKQTGGEVKLG